MNLKHQGLGGPVQGLFSAVGVRLGGICPLSPTLCFFFMFIYLLREREKEQGRGRERGRHRIGSRLQAPSRQHRADMGLEPTDREIMT